jgi:hypothetical protein
MLERLHHHGAFIAGQPAVHFHFSPPLKTQCKITENDDAPWVPPLRYNNTIKSTTICYFPRDRALKWYGISSLLEDDDLQKFCVVVGVRAAPTDILTDHVSRTLRASRPRI